MRDGAYAGGTFDWLSPFSLLTGVAVVAGYALIGATWLVDENGWRGPGQGARAGEIPAAGGAGRAGRS